MTRANRWTDHHRPISTPSHPSSYKLFELALETYLSETRDEISEAILGQVITAPGAVHSDYNLGLIEAARFVREME